MAHVLDAVIQLKDNFSSTLGIVENRVKDFHRTTKNMARDVYRTGKNLESFGGGLTRNITMPAVTATTAVAGMVSVLGWKRLTGLDAAQAQLKGLGYQVEDVERIASQVRNAVQGTVVTMAEGTAVAAGALAAGVQEGEALERYIRLVGAAAVGAGRPVDDMAMIFNRVQGSGKLMTQELNMIEQGMPGFAAAMSKHFDVSQEQFRKMVTDGKVSSTQFLDVMEGFAGGMAEAYANSWAGMVSNVKSNIGIIGETLLGGIFEQSKDSIAEFLELLRSKEVKDWANKVAKPISETFVSVVEGVKSAVGWFSGLDSGTQGLIGKIALAAVAAGPFISLVGKLTTGVGKALYKFSDFAGALKKYGSIVGLIKFPVFIVVAAILALIAAGYLLWKNWDKVMAWVSQNFPNMKDNIATTMGHIRNIFDGVVRFISFVWRQLVPMFTAQWAIIRNVFAVAIETIGGVIGGLLRVFSGIIDFVSGVFTGNWELAWQGVKDIFGGIFDGLVAIAKAPLNLIIAYVNGMIEGLNQIKLPDWVPGLGGKGINIPLIPKLAAGTKDWPGGIAQVHERGGEIIDLPRGSRVYPHDKSIQMALQQGAQLGQTQSMQTVTQMIIPAQPLPVGDQVQAIIQKLIPANIPTLSDIVQTVQQRLEQVSIPTVGDMAQTIKQSLLPANIPALSDIVQTVQQRLAAIRAPTISDLTQHIIQKLIPANVPPLPGATQVIGQRFEPIRTAVAEDMERSRLYKGEQHQHETTKQFNFGKLAETLIVREDADIDKIATALAKKLTKAEVAYGGGW